MSDPRRWFPPTLVLSLVLCGLAASAHAQTCAPAWIATQVYTAGHQASQSGVNYQANWWTQGDSPATHNGGPGSGQPWTSIRGRPFRLSARFVRDRRRSPATRS